MANSELTLKTLGKDISLVYDHDKFVASIITLRDGRYLLMSEVLREQGVKAACPWDTVQGWFGRYGSLQQAFDGCKALYR